MLAMGEALPYEEWPLKLEELAPFHARLAWALRAVSDEDTVEVVPAAPPQATRPSAPAMLPSAIGAMRAWQSEALVGPLPDQGLFSTLLTPVPDEAQPLMTRLMHALVRRMAGQWSRPQLEAMGLSLNPRWVFYGLGPFPALQLEVKDSDAVTDTLRSIFADVGIHLVPKRLGDHSYFEVPVGSWRLVWIAEDNVLMATFAAESALDDVLPLLLGVRQPDEALLNHPRLDALIERYQDHQQLHLVGMFEPARLIDALVPGATGLNATLMHDFTGTVPLLSEVCIKELQSIARVLPRVIVLGYLDRPQEGQMVLEIDDPRVLEGLTNLTHPLPAMMWDETTPPVLNIALGLDVNATIGWLYGRGLLIENDPFVCPMLHPINQLAVTLERDAEPGQVPDQIASIRGFVVRVDQLRMPTDAQPGDLVGFIMVRSTQPELFWQWVKALIPDFADTPLVEGGGLTPIPSFQKVFPNLTGVFQAVLTPNMLGFATGTHGGEELRALTSAPLMAQTPLLSLHVNYARYLELDFDKTLDLGRFGGWIDSVLNTLDVDVTMGRHGIHVRYRTALVEETPTAVDALPPESP